MSSWTGKGAATRIYSPEYEFDSAALPRKMQEQIEKKLHEMGLRLAEYPHYRLTGSTQCRLRAGAHQ